MLLALVSDTHGHVGYTSDAVRLLQQEQPDVVLHCGDIGSIDIVPLFAGWPTHFVFGNVDHGESGYWFTIRQAEQTCHGRFGELELDGVRIAFLHGDDEDRLAETISGGEYDLVCHGHTHQRTEYRRGRTLVVNPGALYRATPHTFAIVELPQRKVRFIEVPH
jgi:putative phosphoesterase